MEKSCLVSDTLRKFFSNDFLSKRDQICRKLLIGSYLMKKSLMENPHFLYSKSFIMICMILMDFDMFWYLLSMLSLVDVDYNIL